MGFFGTWLATTVAVGAAIWLVPGISIVGGTWAAAGFTALFLALINTSIKPVLRIVTLPITFASLGLFYFVVNAFLLEFASYLARNITHAGIIIDGFWPALIGSLVVSAVSALVSGSMR